MLLPRFEYRSARSVDEAIGLCSERPGSRYLAGGTDLLPQLRGGRQAERLVDIRRIPGLHAIRVLEDGAVAIGAAASLAAIASHPAIAERYPVLAQCCQAVGAYPLRNLATLAGNICNASPAADTAVALLALAAEVAASGPSGPRRIPVTELFSGPGSTTLREGELVTEIILPARTGGFRGSYQRLSRRRGMDLATVGVLVAASSRGNSHRVALAAVAPTPLRVRAAEKLLDADPTAVPAAVEAAREAARPITDLRGTADYRRDMVGVLLSRGLAALARGRREAVQS